LIQSKYPSLRRRNAVKKSVEYNRYVIEVNAEWWYVDIYAGNYRITDKANGRLVREVGKAVYRSSLEAARTAAVVAALQYVDQALPLTNG
jgi:hypothetical protein